MTHNNPTRPQFGYVASERDFAPRARRAFYSAQAATDVSARVLADYVLAADRDYIEIRVPRHRQALAAEQYADAVWESVTS